MSCHISNVAAQCFQMKRAFEYKMKDNYQKSRTEALQLTGTAGALAAIGLLGPRAKPLVASKSHGYVKQIVNAPAGIFTVHFGRL